MTDEEMSALRVPPHSRESEQSVLGCLLIDPSAFDRVDLSESDFYRLEHRQAFAAMSALAASGKPVDAITATEELRRRHEDDDDTLAYLSALAQSVPSSAHVRAYAEIVKDKSRQRRLISALMEAQGVAWDAQTQAADKLEKVAAILGSLERVGSRQAPRVLADLIPGRLERLERLSDGSEAPGTPTGMPSLDRMLCGGLRPGAVYVIAARPSVGKSSLAMQLGLEAARRGVTALMLSQEMPSGEVADRAIANTGRIDMGFLQTGKTRDEYDDQWSRLAGSVQTAIDLPFYVDDQPALTLAGIRSKVRQVRGCGLVIVDYVQLCGSDDKGANRNAQIEAITRGLKELAKSMGVVVIALSQLSRKCEDEKREPQMSDLRDSGGIEQDADVVILLWTAHKTDNGPRIVGMKVEKNRQGALGRVALHFDGRIQHWGESTADLDQRHERARRGIE